MSKPVTPPPPPKYINYYCWQCKKSTKTHICLIRCPRCGGRKATISSTDPLCGGTVYQNILI